MNDMERELLPKENRILEAAADLIGENYHAIRTLKVADIANRAGVGKGTVYEYFSSKEEIIQKAVCHCIRRQMEETWTAALSKETFREILYYVMERMLKDVGSPSVWNLHVIMDFLDEKTAKTFIAEMKEYCFDRMMPVWQEILDRGTAEGLFPPKAVSSVLYAFIQLFSGLEFIASIALTADMGSRMDEGYEMLLKILQS